MKVRARLHGITGRVIREARNLGMNIDEIGEIQPMGVEDRHQLLALLGFEGTVTDGGHILQASISVPVAPSGFSPTGQTSA